MAITLRSRREIDLLTKAGAVVGDVLWKLQKLAEPGISTAQLDSVAAEITAKAGAEALFKGVETPAASIAFPGVICASINEQVVHGIPSENVILKSGDLLSVDFGVRLNGYCGDSAVTIAIGQIARQEQKLLDVTKALLDIAVEMMAPGVKWSLIAARMQQKAESNGFSVVTDFVGHGIGTEMWEDPKVPNFVSDELLANDILLKEGMVLAVEPMVNMGKHSVRTLKDGWTVVTKDRRKSAHFEHTIAVVKNGCEVLTGRKK